MQEQNIARMYSYLQSQETGREYLYHCYQQLPDIDAETKSYENCNAFIYYLNHGLQFIETGKISPILMQPILLFYGTTHLLKANLLTKRPNYPESTSILAHGVSTRKRKKKQYAFIDDEVKLQHNGLFAYVAKHLYNMDQYPFEKINMGDLFALIPEMNDLLKFGGNESLIPIGDLGATTIEFPTTVFDGLHLTKRTFIKRIATFLPSFEIDTSKTETLQLTLERPIKLDLGPFFVHSFNNNVYFPVNRKNFIAIPEILIHYLLLYNLSMISRYETEWWGELLATKSDIDYPYINEFLRVTAKKVPFLLGMELELKMMGRNRHY